MNAIALIHSKMPPTVSIARTASTRSIGKSLSRVRGEFSDERNYPKNPFAGSLMQKSNEALGRKVPRKARLIAFARILTA
jgi:hypothetical protein